MERIFQSILPVEAGAYTMPLGLVSQSDFDEERRMRLDAEKARDVAQRLADERASTINDWRQLYQEEVKARAADREAHSAQVKTLLENRPPAIPVDSTPARPITGADVMATAASTKRGMKERKHIAEAIDLKNESEAARRLRQERYDQTTKEEREELAKYDFDAQLGAAFIRPTETESPNGAN